MRSLALLLLLLCGAAACSSSSSAPSGGLAPGEATFDDTLPVMPAHYSATAAAYVPSSGDASIIVTSLRGADACAVAQMSAAPGVANVLQVTVSLDSATIAPGTYALGDGWHATHQLTNAAGPSPGNVGDATQGTLEIDSVDTSVHGVADMTFPDGRVIATFDAAMCNELP